MRICSLLPGATEILFALGLGDRIVGVTHECDYPPEAKQKPIVVRSGIDPDRMTSAEIDRKVGALLQAGKALYTIDEKALIGAAPDIILTQGLCDVCAIDYNHVVQLSQSLSPKPTIVSLNPNSLGDVLDDILRVAEAAQRRNEAQALVMELRGRIDHVGAMESDLRPRVACFEWLDPLFIGGHWIPEMVELAGGNDGLGRKGEPSVIVEWQRVLEFAPEVIVLMPCGFDVRRTIDDSPLLQTLEGWRDLPAVKTGNVFAVNGGAYFSRPGPRLVVGLEMLAQMIHPEAFPWSLSPDKAVRLT